MDEKGLEQYDVLGCLRVATEAKERGLVLTKAALPSQAILTLPAKSLLNVSTLEGVIAQELLPSAEKSSHAYHWRTDEDEDEDNADSDDLHLPLTSVQALTLALAQWKAARSSIRQKQESKWDLLLQSFPERYPTFPLIWKVESESDRRSGQYHRYNALLEALPTHVALQCDKVHKRLHRDLDAIYRIKSQAKHLLGIASECLEESHLIWAWCSVNSRCVHIPLGLQRHLDNFTLAPLLDMANHTFDKRKECKVKWTPKGDLQLSAPAQSRNAEGLAAAQEVFITYGAHSNGTLLSEYGFIIPSSMSVPLDAAWDGNPYAEINVDHIMEKQLAREAEHWGDRKKLLLEDRGYYGDYTIHPFPSPTHPSHRLVIALRLVVIKESSKYQVSGKSKRQKTATGSNGESKISELQAWEEMVNGERDIVSAANEAAVRDLLNAICDEITSSNEDKSKAFEVFVKNHRYPGYDVSKDEDFQASVSLVKNLLQEEVRIAQMLKDVIRRGLTDW